MPRGAGSGSRIRAGDVAGAGLRTGAGTDAGLGDAGSSRGAGHRDP